MLHFFAFLLIKVGVKRLGANANTDVAGVKTAHPCGVLQNVSFAFARFIGGAKADIRISQLNTRLVDIKANYKSKYSSK